MGIPCPRMSIWLALIIQSLLFYWTNSSAAVQVKSVGIGRKFYPKQMNEDNKSKLQIHGSMRKRSDDNIEQNQHSHNLLLIDVSNLENMDNKKADINSKPKLIEIDTSVLSRPLLSTFPDQKGFNDQHEIFSNNYDLDDQLFESEQYDEQNDETNDIFPFPIDPFRDTSYAYHPAIDIFSKIHSSHSNAVPYNFPYVHSNSKSTSSEKNQESKENFPIPSVNLWPLDKGTDISLHPRVPTLLSIVKKNVFQRKLPYH